MNRKHQTTLRRKAALKGIGLHSGKKVNCVLQPADAGHGIVFVRTDLSGFPKVKADISRVARTEMNTTLGHNGVFIGTVEHLMAALVGMGIDNALVEMDGPEVPILDGSSLEFVHAIADAGRKDLKGARKVLRLRRTLSVHQGDRWIIGKPDAGYSIKGSISFKHPAIGNQVFRLADTESFAKEVAAARTFGFVREVDYLHKKGLALGASLENAIVLDEQTVINPEGLRFANEFVRHKVLDALGDLALIGLPVEGAIEIHKSGHEIHAAFLRKLLEDPSNYEIIESPGTSGARVATPIYDEEEEQMPLIAAAVIA